MSGYRKAKQHSKKGPPLEVEERQSEKIAPRCVRRGAAFRDEIAVFVAVAVLIPIIVFSFLSLSRSDQPDEQSPVPMVADAAVGLRAAIVDQLSLTQPNPAFAEMSSGTQKPHGSCYHSGQGVAFISTKNDPYRLVRIDPDDLSYNTYTASDREESAACCCYGDYVYVGSQKKSDGHTAVDRYLASSDPPSSPTYWDLGLYGFADSLDTDGTNLYVGTGGARVLKVPLSTGSVSDFITLTGAGSIHSLRYDAETGKLFCHGVTNDKIYRIDPSDMSKEEEAHIGTIMSDDTALTNGCVWYSLDGPIWEDGVWKWGRIIQAPKLDLVSWEIVEISREAKASSYGVFEDESDNIWSAWAQNSPALITKYNPETQESQDFWLSDDASTGSANEIIFCPHANKLLVTVWGLNPFRVFALYDTEYPPPPVGSIAELPDVSGSSSPNYIALAVLAAAVLLALTAGAWYARRRWLS